MRGWTFPWPGMLLTLFVLAIAGCQQPALTPTPSSGPIALPTSTPAPIPTPTLAPLPTPTAILMPTPTRTPVPISALGLIDVHSHLPAGVTLEQVIGLMDESNVAMSVLMPWQFSVTPSGTISEFGLVPEFYKSRPDRFIPFIGTGPLLRNTARWHNPDPIAESLLRLVEAHLKTGLYRGIGEFIVWFYPYAFPNGVMQPETKIPADTPLMKRFLDLAAKYYVPVNIHYEIDAESLPPLKRMLEYGRKTTIILAHNCGRPDPATWKWLLDTYPNVYCDLGGMTLLDAYGRIAEPSPPYVWFVKNPISDRTGHLRPEWQALFEQYADRIVGIGVDAAHVEAWETPNAYKNKINALRKLLSDLSPGAAERIGFKNAQKLLVPTPTPISTPAPTPAPRPTPTPTPVPISALGLIDAHNHLPRGLTLDYLIQLMDSANVAKTVLMTVYYGWDQPQGQGIADENLVVEFYKQQPDRIISFLEMQRPVLLDPARWLQPDERAENLLRFAESQLQTGDFRGMGEFILGHYPYQFPGGALGGSVQIPADTPLMRRFLDLAAKYSVPVTVHYEVDEESLSSLKSMLDYGRRTTIILAHNCGRPNVATLKELLDQYPNLLCDLGGMTQFGAYGKATLPPEGSTWFVKNPIEDGQGRLRPEWKAFFEQYPHRFVGIGYDGAHPEAWGDPEQYNRAIARFRSLLSGLSPGTAEKIGYKNAQKLFLK